MGTVALAKTVLYPVCVALVPVALTYLLGQLIRVATASPHAGRSSFTVDLARPPGYSVQRRVDRLQSEFTITIAMACTLPPWFLAMWLLQERLGADVDGRRVALFLVLAGIAATVVLGVRAGRLSARLRRARLTLRGKMAAGQEFDHLMRAGARVYPDLPGDGFHLDHVIVAPAGVFCVETETRLKPRDGRSVEDATAVYDGQAVHFPDLIDDEPVRHARERGRWLADWLKRATGLVVPVQAAVALPRWVIDRKGHGDVVVMNPREASRLLGRNAILDEAQVEQLAFPLEKLGRGKREPAHYRRLRKGPGAEAAAPGRQSRSEG